MRIRRLAAVHVALAAAALLGVAVWTLAPRSGPPIGLYRTAPLPGDPAPSQRAVALLAAQPVAFEPAGMPASGIGEFLMRGPGYGVHFGAQGPVVMVREPLPGSLFGRLARLIESRLSVGPLPVQRLPLRFEGLHAPIRWQPLEPQGGYSNYFAGSDPARWKTHVPHYGRLWASNLYPGIDLTFHGAGGMLEYDFRVGPMADAAAIRWNAEGADAVDVTPTGALRVRRSGTTVEWRRPAAYQVSNGRRVAVPVEFDLRGRSIGFRLAEYDHGLALVIDPVLDYATLVGGSDNTTNALGLAVDAAGNAYVTGSTCAADYPSTPGAFDTRGGTFIAVYACEDVFVTKIRADGSGLAYSTFLRGSERETAVRIAVDANGAAFITGATQSLDFPTTAGAYSRTAKGGDCLVVAGFKAACTDAFVAKLSPDGAALAYSTLLGGSRMDAGIGIAVDAAGAAYVSGWSNSPDLPVSATAFQKSLAGGTCFNGFAPCFDTFVAKLSPDGASLAYLTYLGGGDQEYGGNIAVDGAGNAYVVGATSSSNFPTTPGVVGPSHTPGTQDDIYVAKLNPTGSALLYSTLVGGSGLEWALGLAVDAGGSAYVVGTTTSHDFPTTPGAFQTAYAGPSNAACEPRLAVPACGDAFVFKLNPTASALIFSTYLGGSGDDAALGVAVDSAQRVWVSGLSRSPNFPSTSDAYYPAGTFGLGNAFLVELSADGKQLLYATGLRGSGTAGTDIRIDGADNVYALAINSSGGSAATPGAFTAGTGGALVSRFSAGAAPAIQVSPTTLAFGSRNIRSLSPAQTVSVTNPSATPLRLGIGLSDSASAFLQSSDCPPTLAPSQSCSVAVRFQPQVTGNSGASLIVNSNAPGSPVSVTFSGSGIDALGGSFVPGALAYPDQQAGTPSARATASLQTQANDVFGRVRSVSVGGANPGDFDVNLSNCVVGSAFCTVDAAFRPLAGATGARSATVTVTADVFGSPFVMPLSGSVATAGVLVAAPAALDYDTVAVNGNAQLAVTLTNTGAAPVTVSALVLAPGEYTFAGGLGACAAVPFQLAAQARCSLYVQLAPGQQGTRNGTLTITDSAPGSPRTVALTGVGVDPAGPQLRIGAPKSNTFGAVQLGTTLNVPAFFNVYNFGGQAATLDVSVPAEFPRDATYSNCGTTLPAGGACRLAFGFAPAAVGARSGVVSIATNAPGSPATIALAGTGVAIPTAAPTPQRLDFGRVGLNVTSALRTVTIPNAGNGVLNLAGISVSGPFTATSHCGATLAAGASCSVDVRATPVSTGISTGLLSLSDDAVGQLQGVGLSVEGVSGAAVQADLATIDFGRQAVGASSAGRPITITNTGSVSADLSGVSVNGDFVVSSDCGASLASGAHCTATLAFRPTLVSDPIPLVGVVSVGGGFAGSPALINVHGLGTASPGAPSRTLLSAAPNPATAGQPVTLTAAVSSNAAGTPTGSVSFLEGNTVLGSGAVAAGQASLTTAALTAGTHVITAQYGGDATFGASTSAAVSLIVDAAATTADFSVRADAPTLTVAAGQSATTTLTVTPSAGFTGAVGFACAGLPAGASCSFAPASVTPSGAAVTSTLTIATSGGAVTAMAPATGPAAPFAVAALGLGLLGVAGAAPSAGRRPRRGARGARAALAAIALLALLGACGGSSSGGTEAGGGTPAGTSTITVTATAASGAPSHAATLSLVVTR